MLSITKGTFSFMLGGRNRFTDSTTANIVTTMQSAIKFVKIEQEKEEKNK